jgi:phosphoribosyl 1,2-cyclic phosphodiesterase
MGLGVTILGSGSSGNSILVHNDSAGIMIDAGFSRKELLKRLGIANLSPEMIKALLITHEHSDHVKGGRVFADQLEIPTYTTADTFKYLRLKSSIGKKVKLFEPGSQFKVEELTDFWIKPFSVQHDCIQPVAFVINSGDIKVGIATDLGHLNRLAIQHLKDCDILILESNHDREMLYNSDRPLMLKKRISSRHGHLSNEDAMNSMDELLTPRTKCVLLAHLSSDCNDHFLVEDLMLEKLTKLERPDILLRVAYQEKPLETVWL